jgi:D-hexose-6-phosphate mutarotase
MNPNEPISRVEPTTRQGGMPILEVTTPHGMAEIHRHGATVTHFQKTGEAPLLFLSQCSRFEAGFPIRGGIPICFPWFGQPASRPVMHGYARITRWDLEAVDYEPNGAVKVRLRLPYCEEDAAFPPFAIEYTVRVEDTLTVELQVTNQSPDTPFAFEECLHTYFHVGDIARVSVGGLKGLHYLDRLAGFERKTENDAVVQFDSEVDRVYLDAPPKLEIGDESLGRRIRIETMNARCAVLWNPWVNKSRAMPDFGDEEYRRMVCVESGNIGTLGRRLQPGESSHLTVRLSSAPL